MTIEEILKDCTIDGNIVRLPKIDLDRKTYMEVAKKLNLIGGVWKSGKIQGFLFNDDPSELLEQITNVANTNIKKDYQFFETSEKLADYLVELSNLKESDKVLEPSAGQGAIVKAIHRKFPNMIVDCCELMEINQTILKKLENINFVCADFLKMNISQHLEYDCVIANPPFHKNSDIRHIQEMYKMLKDGGTLVSVASVHWKHSENKLEKEFKFWLDYNDAKIIDVGEGAFKESGTNVSTCIIVITK